MKNHGAGSRKVQRRERAKARAEAFAKLSPEEQEKQKANDKAKYYFDHKNDK